MQESQGLYFMRISSQLCTCKVSAGVKTRVYVSVRRRRGGLQPDVTEEDLPECLSDPGRSERITGNLLWLLHNYRFGLKAKSLLHGSKNNKF